MLVPDDGSVIDFSGVVDFEEEFVGKGLKDVNVLIERGCDDKMFLGDVNGVGNGETMVIVV